MFKIDKEEFIKTMKSLNINEIYDYITNYFCKLDELSLIDFDNCFIEYELDGNAIFYIPTNIPSISIEDKLKYILPDDIISSCFGKTNNNWRLRNANLYETICDYSIDIQLQMLHKMFTGWSFEMKEY